MWINHISLLRPHSMKESHFALGRNIRVRLQNPVLIQLRHEFGPAFHFSFFFLITYILFFTFNFNSLFSLYFSITTYPLIPSFTSPQPPLLQSLYCCPCPRVLFLCCSIPTSPSTAPELSSCSIWYTNWTRKQNRDRLHFSFKIICRWFLALTN